MSIVNKKTNEEGSFSQREHHTITQTHSLCLRLQRLHDQQLSHQHLSPLSVILLENHNVDILHHFPPIPFDACNEISSQAVPNAYHPDFLSPEQRGQNNRSIDHSSDFFSIGILMVYWLTGETPLRSDDGSVLLQLPNETDPVVISIIQKLLSLYPEDRYLSLTGLLNDLQNTSASTILFFPGRNDKAETLVFTDMLFGRDIATNELQNLFNTISAGDKKCLLVSGEAGVGKTSLISSTYKQLSKHHGCFCYGKVDFITYHPYSAIINAFSDLVAHHLTNDTLPLWKPRLLTQLKSNTALLGNFIPDLGQRLGTTFTETDSDPLRLKNRLFYACSQLLSLFSSSDSPVIFYIDDLQWMTANELELLHYLYESDISHFLLIGAYRSSECKENHPLTSTLKETNHMSITLDNLSLSDTQEWLHTMFKADTCNALAQTLHSKTHGNPFFTKKLIESLYKNKSITFHKDSRSWKWDMTEIQQANLADNIVHLILETFYDLPQPTQMFLQQAACLGTYFSTATLAAAFEYSTTQISHNIEIGLEYNFITETDSPGTYKFTHDRLLRNIYFEIADSKRQQLHWRIANSELSLYNSDHHTLPLVEACQHVVKGKDVIPEGDRLRIIEQLIKGASFAKSNSDFKSALSFFSTAKEIYVKVEIFFNKEKNELIHLLESDTAFLAKEIRLHTELLKQLKTKTLSHKASLEVASQELRYFDYIGDYSSASRIGQTILQKSQIKITGPIFQIKRVFLLASILLSTNPFTNMQNPKLPKDKKIKLMLASQLSTIFYRTDHKKMGALLFKQLELSKNHAPNNTTPFSLLILSIYITHTLKLRKIGIRLAKEALKLEKEFPHNPNKCQFHQIYATFVQCWLDPINNLPKHLKKAIKTGLITGDQTYTEIAQNNLVNVEFHKGTSRQKLEKHIQNVLKIYDNVKSLRKIPMVLIDLTQQSMTLSKALSVKEELKKIQDAEDYNLLASLYTKQAITYFHLESEEALTYAKKALELASFQKGFFLSIETYFWNAFILNSAQYKKRNKKAITTALKVLAPWKNENNPSISAYFYALTGLKLSEENETEITLFKSAIKEALKTNNYLLSYFLYREIHQRTPDSTIKEKKKYKAVSNYYWKKWNS